MALLEQDRFERMSGIIKGLPANVAIGPHLIRTPKSRFFINSRGGKFRSAGKLRLISISSASLVGHPYFARDLFGDFATFAECLQ